MVVCAPLFYLSFQKAFLIFGCFPVLIPSVTVGNPPPSVLCESLPVRMKRPYLRLPMCYKKMNTVLLTLSVTVFIL